VIALYFSTMARPRPKRYLAVYLRDHKEVLTLVIRDTELGWVAQLLENRTPEPVEVFSRVVMTPKHGKMLLEQVLENFLAVKNWPHASLNWVRTSGPRPRWLLE
jgi:hypothetical protein